MNKKYVNKESAVRGGRREGIKQRILLLLDQYISKGKES